MVGVVSGTTQGTVLGFLLFLIFVNDLPKKCSQDDESLIVLLADDTKTYQEVDSDIAQQATNQQALQNRVDQIAQWASDWRMEINPSKSKMQIQNANAKCKMHLGRNNPGLHYSINGTPIQSVATEKDIGFWISDDLSPTTMGVLEGP